MKKIPPAQQLLLRLMVFWGFKPIKGYFLCLSRRLRFFLLCFAILARRFFFTDAIENNAPASKNQYKKLTIKKSEFMEKIRKSKVNLS